MACFHYICHPVSPRVIQFLHIIVIHNLNAIYFEIYSLLINNWFQILLSHTFLDICFTNTFIMFFVASVGKEVKLFILLYLNNNKPLRRTAYRMISDRTAL